MRLLLSAGPLWIDLRLFEPSDEGDLDELDVSDLQLSADLQPAPILSSPLDLGDDTWHFGLGQ